MTNVSYKRRQSNSIVGETKQLNSWQQNPPGTFFLSLTRWISNSNSVEIKGAANNQNWHIQSRTSLDRSTLIMKQHVHVCRYIYSIYCNQASSHIVSGFSNYSVKYSVCYGANWCQAYRCLLEWRGRLHVENVRSAGVKDRTKRSAVNRLVLFQLLQFTALTENPALSLYRPSTVSDIP